jgi:hypothetical protein
MKPDEHSTAPLRCEVKGNRLQITIGIETLVWASRVENGGPAELEQTPRGEKLCRVDGRRQRQWAEDVAREIIREDEVGNSPLNEFLDEMMVKAADNGSQALNFRKLKTRNRKS